MLDGVIILAVIGALGAAFGLWVRRGMPRATNQRTLAAGQIWSVADMPAAEVGRVVGVARGVGAERLTAPISGRPCLFYAVTVQWNDEWRHELGDIRGIVFELDDGTGVATIDPSRVTSALPGERFDTGVLTAPTPRQLEFLERRGYNGAYLGLRVEEAIVEDGQRIAVFGAAERSASGQLRIVGTPKLEFVIGDDRGGAPRSLPPARLRG